MRSRLLFLVVVAMAVLSGCADRIAAPVLPAAARVGALYDVFVATNRQVETGGEFGTERAKTLSFRKMAVSVPPNRKTGRVPQGFKSPDPSVHFTYANAAAFEGSKQFVSALRSHLSAKRPGDREVTIFVHGYNNSFNDGVFRVAQLMHDLELPGTAVHFSWPSAANPLGYTYDRDSVLLSRDALEAVLADVAAAKPDKIIIAGHSMGSLLIMEALRQRDIRSPGWSRRHIDGVFFLSPDIDIDLFKSQVEKFGGLPEPFVIFVSQKDRALLISEALNGSRHRLGILDDPTEIEELPVTLVDISTFSKARDMGHFTLGTSAVLLRLFSKIGELEKAFRSDRSGRPGLLPGTVIHVRNATQLILSSDLVTALP